MTTHELTVHRIHLVEGAERVLIRHGERTWSYPSEDVRAWARRLAVILSLDSLPEVAAKLLLTDRAVTPLHLQLLEIPPNYTPPRPGLPPRSAPVPKLGRKAPEHVLDDAKRQAVELMRSGFSAADAASETGLGLSTVYRLQKEARSA